LFGEDYNFEWIKDYNKPKFSKSYIKFKNLNFNIDSLFEDDDEKNSFKSKMNIELLRKKISLNYFVNKNEIEFFNDKENLNNSNLIGKINLNPFFFNLNLNLSNLDIEIFMQYFFLYLYSFENKFHDNLTGNIKFNIDKLNNKYFNNLKFNLNFQEGKVNFENGVLKLNKIGKINILDVKYINRENSIYLRLKIELIINDQNEFYRRFQISRNDRVKLSKIYSFVEKNIDKNEYFIEKIYFNNMPISNDNNDDVNSNSNKVENFQALSKLIKDELKQINSD